MKNKLHHIIILAALSGCSQTQDEGPKTFEDFLQQNHIGAYNRVNEIRIDKQITGNWNVDDSTYKFLFQHYAVKQIDSNGNAIGSSIPKSDEQILTCENYRDSLHLITLLKRVYDDYQIYFLVYQDQKNSPNRSSFFPEWKLLRQIMLAEHSEHDSMIIDVRSKLPDPHKLQQITISRNLKTGDVDSVITHLNIHFISGATDESLGYERFTNGRLMDSWSPVH
ncbi:MAG: hypothetical protein GC181_11815 [Bacteroidetes bacterium]|nr:hypothetical protein [Bacteroidota bacterium]